MKKPLLAILLTILLLLPSAAVTSAEVGGAEFTTTTQEALLGTIVSLKVSVRLNAKEGEALNTWRSVLSYNAEALEYVGFAITDDSTREVSVSGLDSLWVVNDEEPGRLVIAFSNAYGCKEDGYLVTLMFRAIAAGNAAIDMKDVVYSTYRADDSGIVVYTKVDSVLTTLSILESYPEPTATATPTASPSPSATAAPTSTAVPTISATPTATTEPAATPTDEPESTRVPTPTPTRKPRQTPTANPTAASTETPMPTVEPTEIPSPKPTDVPTPEPIPTEVPTVEPTTETRIGSLVTDGEGGCSTFGNGSLGILILDIGIAFLALQLIIVVLIILRQRRKASNTPGESKSTDEDPDDLDFRK